MIGYFQDTPESFFKHTTMVTRFLYLIFYVLLLSIPCRAQQAHSRTVWGKNGEQIRITAYGATILRVQFAKKGEEFFANDRYEMVQSHHWTGSLKPVVGGCSTGWNSPGIRVCYDKQQGTLKFFRSGAFGPFLEQLSAVRWDKDSVTCAFAVDTSEHFTGLGHGYYGRAQSIDLQGTRTGRNYGTEHGQQAPLIVPFYLSSKGYGVFVNSSFPNSFSFGADGRYEIALQGGQLDLFIILGPSFTDMLDRYTQLTGRPRLPPKSFFGLALSDKGNDHTSKDPSDEAWWKRKIGEHCGAGFPIDHIVNDNRWRAGGGQRCLSRFAWDSTRYPDPKEYAAWVKKNGMITTLDFNRCIAEQSAGWKTSYNIPDTKAIEFGNSAPDFTRKEVRRWFWNLAWTQSLNPAMKYPGDALWIDEFDEMGKAPVTMTFSNGRTWGEMRNYWFFLIGKALVQEGWDKKFQGSKRPFVWVRGMTAGAQRFATLWSGDIRCTFSDMESQVVGLQLAGLSGFPFWGHDAGGFYNWDEGTGPTDTLYRQWSMAFGSFTPFWKPHGVGPSRWPLDRGSEAQRDAHIYTKLRYELMPYTYTLAHLASQKGIPMARALVIDYSSEPKAWIYDREYMWGPGLLVAPQCSGTDRKIPVWLPEGKWYKYWNDSLLEGGRVINYPAKVGELALFVKAGSIIPMAPFALSTAFQKADSLTLHVYAGADGSFNLYEDDGLTESYLKKQQRQTRISFRNKRFELIIKPAAGSYAGAPGKRVWSVVIHGADSPSDLLVNGKLLQAKWDDEKKLLTALLPASDVEKEMKITKAATR
jgi:alpha-glucosidase (family GH31 glycosyl hydrolase)